MQIQTSNNQTIESQGISGQNSFSIKTSGHAFRLLSSGLYTNKIQAVIRELSCNAADAHVLNSKQKTPFDIKLPNSLDGQFYVRDYGPGLDERSIMSLYTTYFESTKQKSNDFTGGFGVGSKSPFAYTDMFTVVSIHDGLKGSYTAYVDEGGEPKIAKLGDLEATAEPSGLSVGFPVKPEDFQTFKQEAAEVLKWFNSPYNALGLGSGDMPTKYDADRTLIKTSHAVIFGRNNGGYVTYTGAPSATSHDIGVVVMGNVHYPLPFDECIRDMPEANWFNGHKAVFPIPIGSVSVAASREALSLDKFTKTALRDIVKNAFQEVAIHLWDMIEKHVPKGGETSLKHHLKALQTLSVFKLNDPQIIPVFLDAMEATPQQRQLFEPRYLEQPNKPLQTFSIVELSKSFGSNNELKCGNPLDWDRNKAANHNAAQRENLQSSHEYYFIENGARAHGPRVNSVASSLVSHASDQKNHSYNQKVYMLVPHPNVKALDYEQEKEEWMAYLGADVAVLSTIGETFKNEGVLAWTPFDYRVEQIELLANTPAFFWLTRTEFKAFGGDAGRQRYRGYDAFSEQRLVEMQKNLGISDPITKFYIIPDSDVEKLKTTCSENRHLLDDFAYATLLSPKIQKKIGKIKPMMTRSSHTLTAVRGIVKREPAWEDCLKDSKIGEWVGRMKYVKGSTSFDFTTMELLTKFQKVLGVEKFPSIIPEYYDGLQVQKKISADYPFLETSLLSRVTLSVDKLQHMKTYIAWCESNGASPPQQSSIDDDLNASPSP